MWIACVVEAAAELAVEGAAPARLAVVDRAAAASASRPWRPRRSPRSPCARRCASFCRPWPKRYWKIGQARPAERRLGGGDRVDLGEALGHRLLDHGVLARLEHGDRLRLVQARRACRCR